MEVGFQPGFFCGGRLSDQEIDDRKNLTTAVEVNKLVQSDDFKRWLDAKAARQEKSRWVAKNSYLTITLVLLSTALCILGGTWLLMPANPKIFGQPHASQAQFPAESVGVSHSSVQSSTSKLGVTPVAPHTLTPPLESCPMAAGDESAEELQQVQSKLAGAEKAAFEAEKVASEANRRRSYLEAQLARSEAQAASERAALSSNLRSQQAELQALKRAAAAGVGAASGVPSPAPQQVQPPVAPDPANVEDSAVPAAQPNIIFTAASGMPQPAFIRTLLPLLALLAVGELAIAAWRAWAGRRRDRTELGTLHREQDRLRDLVEELKEELDEAKEDLKNMEEMRIENEEHSESLWRSKCELENQVKTKERELRLKEQMINDLSLAKKQLDDKYEDLEFQCKELWKKDKQQELNDAHVAKKALEERVGVLEVDLADELAQTQEGDAGVVTPKAASTRNELDHAFMIKGLVDDRVAELEEQLLSLQEHACEAADVLKADKVALEAKAKRLEEHVLEMTRSRVAYKALMEAAEADLKGRLALAEEQNLLLNKQLADLQAACATHEKRRQELAATVQALQEVLLSKDAEVEGLAEQRGALEEQLLDTLRNLLPILKDLDGLEKVLAQGNTPDAFGELEGQVAESLIETGAKLVKLMRGKVDALLRLANLLSEAHYFHPMVEAYPVAGSNSPDTTATRQQKTAHLALYMVRRMANITRVLAVDGDPPPAAAGSERWHPAQEPDTPDGVAAGGCDGEAVGGKVGGRNMWVAWHDKIRRVRRNLEGPSDGGAESSTRQSPVEMSAAAADVAAAAAEPFSASSEQCEVSSVEFAPAKQTPLDSIREREEKAAIESARLASLEEKVVYAEGVVADMRGTAEGYKKEAQDIDALLAREKSGLDCQPGKVEELTVRRATVADLLCWVLAQLSEAEAELVHMRDRAAAARASSVSGAPSAMHDSPWDAAPLDGCTAAGEHCAKPPASDGGCGAGFNSDLKVLSPEPVQAPVKTGSEVSGELLDSPRDATPPGVSPTGTERRARLPSEDGGAGLRLDAGIQVPSPTSEPAGCGGFDDGTAVAPRFDAGTGAAGETFADEVPAGEVEMLRLGGRAFVPPSRNGRLDVAPAGSGDFSGADPGPAKRPRGGYAGGGKAWGAGGEADPEQMHENPAFGLPDASVRLGASVIQFQELSSAFEATSPPASVTGMQRAASSPHPFSNITNHSSGAAVESPSKSRPVSPAPATLTALAPAAAAQHDPSDPDLGLPRMNLWVATGPSRAATLPPGPARKPWGGLKILGRPRLSPRIASQSTTATRPLAGGQPGLSQAGRALSPVRGQPGPGRPGAPRGNGASPDSPWSPDRGDPTRLMDSQWQGTWSGAL